MPEPAPHRLTLTLDDADVTRGGRVVAARISFTLAPGEALTLRGENGTGKTSILRAVAGFAPLEGGQILFGDDGGPADAAAVRALGVHWLGGDDGLAARLTVAETLAFWSGLYGVPIGLDLLEPLGLMAKMHAPTGTLSTGQRRRCALARLIAIPRPLWLLDEPLSGLDEAARQLLFAAVATHRARGGLVLMASHDDGLPDARTLRLATMAAA